MFMGASLDSSNKHVQAVSLDGIRFISAETYEQQDSLTELTLGPNVAFYPLLNEHSKDTPLPRSVIEMMDGKGDDEKKSPTEKSEAEETPVNMETLIEDAAAGGYKECSCSDYPCNHILEAAAKGKGLRDKKDSEESKLDSADKKVPGTVDFGKAVVFQQFFSAYVFGQVFKRKNMNDASSSASLWTPGDVIAQLPENSRPENKCSFIVLAGKSTVGQNGMPIGGPFGGFGGGFGGGGFGGGGFGNPFNG
jgi:hypothetical protein